METTKKCSKCGRELPIEQFSLRSKATGQLQCWCKDCMNEAARKRHGSTRLGTLSDATLVEELKRRGKNICLDMTPRSAMEYLASMGYKGKLTFTRVETIDITNF